jgi:hypothetical protein
MGQKCGNLKSRFMSQVKFGLFKPEEEGEVYLSHMRQGDILLFENSAHLLNVARKWLQAVGMADKYDAAVGTDLGVKGFLILGPKSTAQPNREFSKNVMDSELAKKKSKLSPK